MQFFRQNFLSNQNNGNVLKSKEKLLVNQENTTYDQLRKCDKDCCLNKNCHSPALGTTTHAEVRIGAKEVAPLLKGFPLSSLPICSFIQQLQRI